MSMKKDVTKTPNTQIASALRMLFLRSRERRFCIKANNGNCEVCGIKTKEGLIHEHLTRNVHHRKGINWNRIFEVIREELLCNYVDLQCLCRKCHYELHGFEYKPNMRIKLEDRPTEGVKDEKK